MGEPNRGKRGKQRRVAGEKKKGREGYLKKGERPKEGKRGQRQHLEKVGFEEREPPAGKTQNKRKRGNGRKEGKSSERGHQGGEKEEMPPQRYRHVDRLRGENPRTGKKNWVKRGGKWLAG